MANTTLYVFGESEQEPSGIMLQKIADIQDTIDLLGDWAFITIPNPANPVYRNVVFLPSSSAGVALLRCGYTSSLVDYFMSPVFDLGEIGSSYSLRFSVGETVNSGQYPGIIYFDEDLNPYTYHVANANPRSVSGTVSSTLKYARLIFSITHIYDAYLYDESSGEYLFKGEYTNLAKVKTVEHFRKSRYWNDWGPNENGDWLGWNFATTDTAATAQRTVWDYPILRPVGANASPFSYGVSKLVELPSNTTISVEFSCGETNSNLMLRLINPSTETANYYAANANPRTVSVNTSTYTHVQLYFLTANYSSCYIKDATNDEMLWQGSSS